ncbi:MAG: hypothetical protein EPO24_04890 [Bacteroidetes bacterium]|nr:MAG: hypothetical protein EPO24_04890 [Bacteroidota bacterium]
MQVSLNYVNDTKGTLRAVQMPIEDWKKVLDTLRRYEQALQVQSDLTTAFAEVEMMRAGKLKKKTLSSFLHEL